MPLLAGQSFTYLSSFSDHRCSLSLTPDGSAKDTSSATRFFPALCPSCLNTFQKNAAFTLQEMTSLYSNCRFLSLRMTFQGCCEANAQICQDHRSEPAKKKPPGQSRSIINACQGSYLLTMNIPFFFLNFRKESQPQLWNMNTKYYSHMSPSLIHPAKFLGEYLNKF